MDVFEAVASRYSCRAFLPTPVPEATVRDILERAARAPSGGNVQPWRVHALAGERLEALRAIVRSRLDELPRFEGAEYDIYPRDLKEPYEEPPPALGRDALSIDRRDARRPRRALQAIRAQFPVLRRAGRAVLLDRPQHGSAAMVGPRRLYPDRDAARARPRPARLCPGSLDALCTRRCHPSSSFPPNTSSFCGMALGHADTDAPINNWRAPREPLDAFASFEGFEG